MGLRLGKRFRGIFAGISVAFAGAVAANAAPSPQLVVGSSLRLKSTFQLPAGYPEVAISQESTSRPNGAICTFRAAKVTPNDRTLSPSTAFTVAQVSRFDTGTPGSDIPNQALMIAVTDSTGQLNGAFWCYTPAKDPFGPGAGALFPTSENLSTVFQF